MESLVLQFPLLFPSALTVGFLRAALVAAAPARPGDDRLRDLHHGPDEANEEPPELGDGERDVRRAGAPLFAVPMANAAKPSSARVTCRDQPCQLRTSYRSRPTCPLASLKTSSIVHRDPATRTISVSGVSLGAKTREYATSSVRTGCRRSRALCSQPSYRTGRSGTEVQSYRRGPCAPSPQLKRCQASAGTAVATSVMASCPGAP